MIIDPPKFNLTVIPAVQFLLTVYIRVTVLLEYIDLDACSVIAGDNIEPSIISLTGVTALLLCAPDKDITIVHHIYKNVFGNHVSENEL